MSKQILMIVTSHGRIDAERKTGLWYEELAEPYSVFQEQGYDITVASPQGGAVPIDPNSNPDDPDEAIMKVIENTYPLSEIDTDGYDALFIPGGHGAMFDLATAEVGAAVEAFIHEGRVVGSVCHGPAGLVEARNSAGLPTIDGYRLTSFTNAEEEAAGLVDEMPFLLQSKLEELGARFETADNYTDHVVVDRNLVTGQNPQSSASAAHAMVDVLQKASANAEGAHTS